MSSTPSDPTPSDRELLSAYLADDLDEQTANALEARLAEEPALAAALDEMAVVLGELQGVSDVDPPAGYQERLRARLAGERAGAAGEWAGAAGAPAGEPAGATGRAGERAGAAGEQGEQAGAADAGGGATVTALDAVRRRPWPAVTAAAAVVLLAAVVSAGVLGALPFGGPQSQDLATGEGAGGDTEAAERAEDSGLDSADRRGPSTAEDDSFRGDTDDAPAPHAAPAPESGDQAAPPGPVVLDRRVALADEAAVRRRHDDLPEAVALLGRSLPEARETARAHRRAIAEAPAFRSGVRPDACLDEAAGAGDRPRVPVRVETVVYAGEPALAYVVVEASPEAVELDRVVSVLVDPGSCERRAVVVVEPAPS